MIDEVVGICVELKPGSLVDGEFLLKSEIPVLEAWPVDAVADAPLQIEGARCRLGEDRRAITVGRGEVFVVLLRGIPRNCLRIFGDPFLTQNCP